MPIRVQVACDDKSYRDAIEAVLVEDPTIEVVKASREAEQGVFVAGAVRPEVIVLAVPPREDVAAHTRLYQLASRGSRLVAFCLLESQEQAYREAGVDALVRPTDTADALRAAVFQAHRSTDGGEN